jgi:hypothetical protein
MPTSFLLLNMGSYVLINIAATHAGNKHGYSKDCGQCMCLHAKQQTQRSIMGQLQ